MLRLVKVLNGNLQYEVVSLKPDTSVTVLPGSALLLVDGVLIKANETSMPDYIAITGNEDTDCKKINAVMVTENMVFKTEYEADKKPYIGMKVGLCGANGVADTVTYNENGKGTVLGIEDGETLVYVKFHR